MKNFDAATMAKLIATGVVTAAPFADVPVPPSVNNLFATVRGHRVKSKGYKAWLKNAVPVLAGLARPERFPCRVCVILGGKVNMARDLDNILKPIGDALVAAGGLPGDNLKYVAAWDVAFHKHDGEPKVRVRFELLPA